MDRILVVDDEEDLCEILKFNLESDNYTVDTALSAEEALKMNLEQYNLILLDVMMGEISGYKMAQIMKNNPQHKNIPIICTIPYNIINIFFINTRYFYNIIRSS